MLHPTISYALAPFIANLKQTSGQGLTPAGHFSAAMERGERVSLEEMQRINELFHQQVLDTPAIEYMTTSFEEMADSIFTARVGCCADKLWHGVEA